MPKKVQATTQLYSSHMLANQYSKFSKWSFNSMQTGNFQMFKLDLEKIEKPEIKLPNLLDYQKSKTVPEKYLLLLYWLCQSFWLCGQNKMCKILKEIGMPDHLTYLLRNLYAGQEATVSTGHGTTDWFQIRRVRQGCTLSPYLFNLYAE